MLEHLRYRITIGKLIIIIRKQSIDRRMVSALFYCNIIVYGKIRNPDITKAGDGNRTHVSSLEGWCSTIELHPHVRYMFSTETILSYEPADCKLFLKKTHSRNEKNISDNPVKQDDSSTRYNKGHAKMHRPCTAFRDETYGL